MQINILIQFYDILFIYWTKEQKQFVLMSLAQNRISDMLFIGTKVELSDQDTIVFFQH